MAKIDSTLIQKLRTITGLGMMDCKKALEEAEGNVDKAVELLRKKGAAIAAKRADKATVEGCVQAYIHPGSKLGVLVEVNCETDFVANTSDVINFTKDLCMHIAAVKPLYLNPADVDPKLVEYEKDIIRTQLKDSGKPENIIEQIVNGKINKLYEDICLMKQVFIKNDKQTITDLVNDLMAKTGEKITVRRFARFSVGE